MCFAALIYTMTECWRHDLISNSCLETNLVRYLLSVDESKVLISQLERMVAMRCSLHVM